VESASTFTVYDRKVRSDIIVSETVDYPLKALVLTSSNLKTLVSVLSEISFSLHDNATAYSLLISNNGTKAFLFPQVKSIKPFLRFIDYYFSNHGMETREYLIFGL
jgi:GDP-L-galactose phosphorylase